MSDQATLNLLWADALMDGLAAAGVRHTVLSPGSRSTPLVLACERHPLLQTHLLVDERCAAFFALGLARQSRQPVALIATSGSAPAHWYPAVIEANHAGVPLLLLSADRPPELQGCGANQTIDQTRLFGTQVRAFHDAGPAGEGTEALHRIRVLGLEAVHQACRPEPGPVHINLPFREPLVPAAPLPSVAMGETAPVARPKRPPESAQIERIGRLLSDGPGMIVCGPGAFEEGFPAAVTALAAQLRVPLLADPLSNLRFGGHDRAFILSRYDTFLRRGVFTAACRPAWVLRFGGMPVSKSLLQYLEGCGAPNVLVAPYGDWPDPLRQAVEKVRADPALCCDLLGACGIPPAPEGWFETFQAEEQRCVALAPVTQDEAPREDRVIVELLAALPEGSVLFSGNSLPVRQLDGWSGSGEKPLRIFANRGASGIDGNLSTLFGMAAAAEPPVAGLLGDLAFYHDMNGLLAARGRRVVIVLLNNGGGGIFGYLPQADLAGFEQHWLAPTGLDFSRAASLYGLEYERIERQSAFRPALERALAADRVTLLEVMLDREQSQLRQQQYWQTIASD